MRHGDRTPIHPKLGDLDLSQLAGCWQTLLPSSEQRAAMDRFVVRLPDAGNNSYAAFSGKPPFGQLTSRGVNQCRAVGREFRRRYPESKLEVMSTNFPRTIDSAKAFLCGFDTTDPVEILVRHSKAENLLPDFDGSCKRFQELNKLRKADAERQLQEQKLILNQSLTELLGGDDPVSRLLCPNHFKILYVNSECVGVQQGVNLELVKLIDEYYAAQWSLAATQEFIQLATGRLLRECLEFFQDSSSDPQLRLCLAHDSTLVPFMQAVGAFRLEFPPFASTVILEVTDIDHKEFVRILVNDDVRLDWQPLQEFCIAVSQFSISEEGYQKACF